MRDFEYFAPASLADAVVLMERHAGAARPLAGGTDLIDLIRTDRLAPDVVVDIKKIAELNVLDVSANGLRLGAAVPCRRITADPRLARDYAALVDSCALIGSIQIQNRASVGGNLCNASAAADAVPSLIALEATCVIAGPNGTREVPVEEFCTGPRKTVLQPGELLVELKFPPRIPRSGSHYRRFIPRNEMDIAVVGVAARVLLDETGARFVSARIGLCAVGPKPILAAEACRLLAGQPVGDEALDRAAKAAVAVATPIDDMRGTAEFRKHVTGVLTRRALETAVARARKAS